MTPPLPKATLSKIVPKNSQQLEDAIKHVESLSQKEKRSLSGSMTAFVKQNPDPAVGAASGNPKKTVEFLAKLHLHQVKSRESWKILQRREVNTGT